MLHKEDVLADFLNYTEECISIYLKSCELAYQKPKKPWHHHLGFSKLFKVIIIFTYFHVSDCTMYIYFF